MEQTLRGDHDPRWFGAAEAANLERATYPVTRLGGKDPIWSPDGRMLYYAGVGAEEGQLFAVTIETEPELEVSERRTVFSNMDGVTWIVPMPGGRVIKLQSTSQGAGNVPDMRLILNWDLPKLISQRQ